MSRTLVLGGARSGKSVYAERLASDLAAARGGALVYVATAEAWDDEMRARIAEHRARRGADWTLFEAPRDLGGARRATARADRVVLIDCLTLWLTNELLAKEATPDLLQDALSVFLAAFRDAPGAVVAVSNEVGLGVVPESALGRAFRDAQGRLNQNAAAAADHVVFVAAGLPVALKGERPA